MNGRRGTPIVTMTTDPTLDAAAQARRDTLAGRLFEAAIQTADLQAVYLGLKLGLYEALAATGPQTAPELAARVGMDARYAREWLEHQAVGGFLTVDDVAAAPDERRYAMPAGHAEVLIDPESPWLTGPIANFFVASAQRMPEILEAYRTGDGVDWADYGPDVVHTQEALNRPQFQHFVGDWIRALPDIATRLDDGEGRIADIGCGTGWSSIWMARHFPGVEVHGIDIDEGSIARATAHAEREGMTDRLSFLHADAAAADGTGRYDLVTIFEALHDMANPVQVLEAARRLLAPGGAVLIGDERVEETFTAPSDGMDRMFYGYSIIACLPNGRVDTPSVATGTVIRPSTLEAYAKAAGFGAVTILPTEHDAFRFYRLDP
jgi:2-polyprenyl-3-methyl-5-hydroxy-6-metoxy-1,4-benzoquinol methylase